MTRTVLRVIAGGGGREGAVTPRWGRSPEPLIIGHRGASAHEVENTLSAFRRARADGADGVELDVLLCASGEVVVFHDEDLERLAGRPERVEELPLAALREVRLKGGEAIPTLAEVLEELGPGLLVNVELKAPRPCAGRRLVPAVVELVRRFAAADRVLVSSFNPLAVLRFRALAPEIPSGLIFGAEQALPLRRAWARGWVKPFALHPERTLCTERTVQAWRAAGYAVNVWTVDDPDEVARLCALGVDGLITNDPARTRQLRR